MSVLVSVRSATPCSLARYGATLVVRKFCCCRSLQLCAAKCNRARTHYESTALAAELRACAVISTTCTELRKRRFFTVVEIEWTSEAPPAPAASTLASSTIACSAFVAFNSGRRSKACSMPAGVGCMYRSETVTLLWAAIFMIVNASALVSPEPVKHRVAQRMQQIPWTMSRYHRAPPHADGQEKVPRIGASGESPGKSG